MNETSNVLRGILHPDGTLELAERPTLPAGDVEVTIRPVPSEAPRETLWEYMQRTRAELEASGHQFRTKEEIDADIEEMRDWGEDRLDEIHRQAEASRSVQPADPDVTNDLATNKTPGEPLWEAMQRSRAELEASGCDFFRTEEEVDAYIEDLRDWDGKVDEVYRQGEEERRRVAPQ